MGTRKPQGVSRRELLKVGSAAGAALQVGAQAYLPPPDGRFAGYRPPPEWLQIERWFDVEVTIPQVGG